MENNYSFIHSIIASLKATVNQFALNRLTENVYLDPEAVSQAMQEYGDRTLGAYATRTLVSKFFSRKAMQHYI